MYKSDMKNALHLTPYLKNDHVVGQTLFFIPYLLM